MNWDDVYIQRTEIENDIINSTQNCFIFGARRVGKTSLLQYLETFYNSNGTLALYISIENINSSENMQRKIINRARQRDYPFPRLNSSSFFDFMEEADAVIEKPIVFLVDEMEKVAAIEKREPGFLAKLGELAQNSKNFRFIFTASPRFKKIIPESDCSDFLAKLQPLILPIMTDTEVEALINKLVPVPLTRDKIYRILNYTNHQPFFVKRFLAKLLQNGTMRLPKDEIAKETYVNNNLDVILDDYFMGLSEDEKNIIRQIHASQFEMPANGNIVLTQLETYGYIKSKPGGYFIPNWFFRQYLAGNDFKDDLRGGSGKPEAPPGWWQKLSQWQRVVTFLSGLLGLIFTGITIFNLLFSPVSTSQFEAQVIDCHTKTGITGVVVILTKTADQSRRDSTKTDSAGRFVLPVKAKPGSKIHLIFKHPAYQNYDGYYQTNRSGIIELQAKTASRDSIP